MKENPFAAKFVRIDRDAGHKVITTGPYAVVRHPMYAGLLLVFPSMSIALSSLYGLIPIVFIAILLLVRISFEENFCGFKYIKTSDTTYIPNNNKPANIPI